MKRTSRASSPRPTSSRRAAKARGRSSPGVRIPAPVAAPPPPLPHGAGRKDRVGRERPGHQRPARVEGRPSDNGEGVRRCREPYRGRTLRSKQRPASTTAQPGFQESRGSGRTSAVCHPEPPCKKSVTDSPESPLEGVLEQELLAPTHERGETARPGIGRFAPAGCAGSPPTEAGSPGPSGGGPGRAGEGRRRADRDPPSPAISREAAALAVASAHYLRGLPTKGLRPVNPSYSMTPRLYQSLASVTGRPAPCSGDMYAGVPAIARL